MKRGAGNRVIVCGGRDFMNGPLLDEILSAHLREGDTVIHGDARGADRLAGLWAQVHGYAVESHPANWAKYGKAAGAIRNQEMLDAGADLVIAFPGGKGTANMVKIARAAGVPVDFATPTSEPMKRGDRGAQSVDS